MARQWSLGFEMNSTSNGVEFDGHSGSPVISSTEERSGSYCGQISSLSSGTPKFFRTYRPSGYDEFYLRAYIKFTTFPSAENTVISMGNNTDPTSGRSARITVNNVGDIRVYDSSSFLGDMEPPRLKLNRYYCFEVYIDRTGSSGNHIIHFRLDHKDFWGNKDINRTISTSPNMFFFGGNLNNETQTTGTWYFDDLALNDTTGDYENKWCDAGHIIVLRPNGEGLFSTSKWDTESGAGTSNNYQKINETPPDNDTSYLISPSADATDSFLLENPNLDNYTNIKLMSINSRHARNVAETVYYYLGLTDVDDFTNFSTNEEIILNSSGYMTNNRTTSQSYEIPIATYYRYDDGTKFTSETFDNLELLLSMNSLAYGASEKIKITALWVTVEYRPLNIQGLIHNMQNII